MSLFWSELYESEPLPPRKSTETLPKAAMLNSGRTDTSLVTVRCLPSRAVPTEVTVHVYDDFTADTAYEPPSLVLPVMGAKLGAPGLFWIRLFIWPRPTSATSR